MESGGRAKDKDGEEVRDDDCLLMPDIHTETDRA